MGLLPKIKPDNSFVNRTRIIYLENFKNKFPAGSYGRRGFHHFALGFSSGIAVILIISGSAVYADQTNVPVSNPLYPMKRIYESVNLILAPQSQKPIIQAQLADRRLHEIESVVQQNPQNSQKPQVQNLLNDMKTSVRESLSALPQISSSTSTSSTSTPIIPSAATTSNLLIPAPPVATIQQTNQLTTSSQQINKPSDICQSLNKFFDQDSLWLGTLNKEDPEIMERFEHNCEPVIGREKIKRVEQKKQENTKKYEKGQD